MDNKDLYCKIYVDTQNDRAWLLQKVADHSLGVVAGRTVTSAELTVDVSRNEDFDQESAQVADGFVYFGYYLDILPVGSIHRNAYINAIRRLLSGFAEIGIIAVAACDFESELQDSRST